MLSYARAYETDATHYTSMMNAAKLLQVMGKPDQSRQLIERCQNALHGWEHERERLRELLLERRLHLRRALETKTKRLYTGVAVPIWCEPA